MHAALATGWEAQEGCVEAALWLRSPWGAELPLGPDAPALCVCNPLHNVCVVFLNIHSHMLIVTALVPILTQIPLPASLLRDPHSGAGASTLQSVHSFQRHSICQKFDHRVIILFMIISR